MKILWITNLPFPEVCTKIGIRPMVLNGWIYSLFKSLKTIPNLEICVVTLLGISKLEKYEIDGTKYFIIPFKKSESTYQHKIERYWKQINIEFNPDIVHIHGTEYPQGLAWIKACGNKNVVVSIQGLVSVISKYYYSGISNYDYFRNITFGDIILRSLWFQQKKKIEKRGKLEIDCIKHTKYIIGRTDWDKSHSLAINNEINYFHCNEALRDNFYLYKWSLEYCEKYSIFLSQGAYPLKGLHLLLKALPNVVQKYPTTHLYITGPNILSKKTIRDKIIYSGYAKYIFKLIKYYKLNKNITFLGQLPEIEMCQRTLKSHVIVCPSSIENSPNSIAEGQVIGVPCIASYVGGIPSMIEDNFNGMLYRFEEFEMLANKICYLFENENFALKLSQNSRKSASERHSKSAITQKTIEIYNYIKNRE